MQPKKSELTVFLFNRYIIKIYKIYYYLLCNANESNEVTAIGGVTLLW